MSDGKKPTQNIILPTVTLYDRECLRRFGGDFEVIGKLLQCGFDFSIQILNEENIISLMISGKCFCSREIDRKGSESVLLQFIRYLCMNYEDELNSRIQELLPKKRKKVAKSSDETAQKN